MYGNFRRVGAETDIGFDESDVLTMAGGYFSDSRTYSLGVPCAEACTPSVSGAGTLRYAIFPASGDWASFLTVASIPGNPAWSTQPGTIDFPAIVPGGFGTSTLQWLGAILPGATAPAISTLTVTFPGTGGMPHEVHFAPLGLPDQPGSCEFRNEQVLFVPTDGTIDPGLYISNLQQSFDG